MKPILFNTAMVQAILDGRKTVTRRNPFKFEMKEGYNPDWSGYSLGEYYTGHIETGVCLYSRGAHDVWGVRSNVVRPKYVPGDILYVRETWRCYKYNNMDGDLPFGVQYKADGEKNYFEMDDNERYEKFEKLAIKDTWQPSLFMPKEAARIFLRVKDVRVERLQDITEEQAKAEGISEEWACSWWKPNFSDPDSGGYPEYRKTFALDLWDYTVKKSDIDRYGWKVNPWVWVIEFERISKEDAYAERN